LVGNAVGYDSQRRDSITVSSLPFRGVDAPLEDEPHVSWWKQPDFLKALLRNLLFAGVVLTTVVLLYRALFTLPKTAETAAQDSLPRTVAELEAARAAGASGSPLALNKGGTSPLLDDAEPLEKQEETELRKRILEKLGQSPRKGFRIVQDWLEDDTLPMPATES
jgi:flagellar biosynthesis/type III secretory pathway M-ring protein FliF/YscJ